MKRNRKGLLRHSRKYGWSSLSRFFELEEDFIMEFKDNIVFSELLKNTNIDISLFSDKSKMYIEMKVG